MKFLALTGTVLAGVAIVLVLSGGGDGQRPRSYTAPDRAFSLRHSGEWKPLAGRELAAVAGSPAAVLRRADRRGLVVIRERQPAREGLRSFTERLTGELRHRFPGMRPVSARSVAIRGGRAYLYTFVRPQAGTVHGIALATAGRRAFSLDVVTPGDAPKAAAQVGAIVRSFGLPDESR